ncbi:MAG: hypothetical protein DIU74_010905 [Pseudomonadota bacterium]|nr:MAG: hypothetical protein DIU74_04425 [Pseudomonadota bacterium]
MLKTAAITFGLGVALAFGEWLLARRKKEGVTPADRQRMFGILRISAALALLAGWIAWMMAE